MLYSQAGKRFVLIAGLLIVAAAFAGCAGDQAPGGSEGTDGQTPGESGAMEQQQARSSYTSALSVIDEGPKESDRVAMEMSWEPTDGSSGEAGTVKALHDGTKELTVMTMTGRFAETEAGQQSQSFEMLLTGQVHKTSFIGVPPDVFAFYNESAEPPEGFTSVDASPDSGSSSADDSDSGPTAFMSNLTEDPPEDAEFSSKQTTYNGESATEITATYTVGPESFDVRAVVYDQPERPALVEGSVEHATNASKSGSFSLEFTYGDDATHDREEAMMRLETMTIATEGETGFGGQEGSGGDSNHTVQPSQNPGTIPLEEVQVQVRAQDGNSKPGGQSAVLTLDAEAGSAENENVKVTYEDKDGDGAVSPGDRIVLEDKDSSDSKTFSVALHDEKTGINALPVLPVAAIAALAGLVALVRRRW